MQRAWLREFNVVGLQLRPQAAKKVTSFLREFDDPNRVAEALAEHTKNYLRQRGGGEAIIDADIIDAVISIMHDASEGKGEQIDAAMAHGIQTMDLGDGVQVYNALSDVRPFDYKRATKEWVPSPQAPELFPGVDAKAKIYTDRYQILWQRLLLEGEYVPEAETLDGALLPKQRVLTPVESLVGNPGVKITFGLLTRIHDERTRRWAIEDLHKTYPVELEVNESEHLITDGSFVLAEGELKSDGQGGSKFHVRNLDVPTAVPRRVTKEKDDIPSQVFGGDLTEEQVKTLTLQEVDNPAGFYVVLSEVHLDSVRTQQKLSDLFEGYETNVPPKAYVFMGSFCSSAFLPTADGVKAYREGFEHLKFLMRRLPNHLRLGTRFIFVPGPNDPGPTTLPRPALPGYLTAGLADDVPNVILATNPCRIRHLGRELVFFRHDVMRLLRRHEVLPLRQPDVSGSAGGAPSHQHVRYEMVRLLLDQAHLVPLPLEESNILWSFDHALRLYPLPHAVFVGGASEPFECKYQECDFASVGPFHRDASFYAFHPVQGLLEPCDVPDEEG